MLACLLVRDSSRAVVHDRKICLRCVYNKFHSAGSCLSMIVFCSISRISLLKQLDQVHAFGIYLFTNLTSCSHCPSIYSKVIQIVFSLEALKPQFLYFFLAMCTSRRIPCVVIQNTAVRVEAKS
jgi:hypothetical protein